MLFGEWLKKFKDNYNDKFYTKLNEQQLENETSLEVIIMTSGSMNLMRDWKEYLAWSC